MYIWKLEESQCVFTRTKRSATLKICKRVLTVVQGRHGGYICCVLIFNSIMGHEMLLIMEVDFLILKNWPLFSPTLLL